MPTIDIGFRLTGREIPADHSYALYGAVSRHVPWTHDSAQETLGIHPINGLLAGNRLLHLTPSSRLTFRLDSDHVRELLPLAGEELDLDGYKLRVGVPTTYLLKPAATLRSRLVTFKHRMDPESFLAKAQEEFSRLGIMGTPGLIRRSGTKSLEGRKEMTADRSPSIRRTLRIHDKEVVGFAMEVSGLSADDSLRLQEHGLGGRRRFGCGIFVPTRHA
ncbi:MAG TPA: type I-MYXAN CRISPR-associated protein Cas6/Cmx6 [bacterium]|nr:type I-MYXAN CRISPR-associated protein Cas6/Cmx6 [bacterium]